MGTRLADIIMDRHEDFLYEDSRAMKVPPYVMAERCLQAELTAIFLDRKAGDYSTLTYILECVLKFFHNMDPSQLIEEYKQIEVNWYEWYESAQLYTEVYEEDPIHTLEEETV